MSDNIPFARSAERRGFLMHSSSIASSAVLAGLPLIAWAKSAAGMPTASPTENPQMPSAVVSQAMALMLGLVRQNEQNAVRAARGLSFLAAAMFRAHALAGSAQAQPAVLALTAQRVLGHFFPRADQAMLAVWAAGWAHEVQGGATSPSAAVRQIASAAEEAAQAAIRRSLTDGALARWSPSMRPKEFPGIWQATFPMFAVAPLEGLAPTWRTWSTPSPGRYVPPPAHALGSQEHLAETQEVLLVARNLTPHQRERALWWNLDAGSVTPAGVWLRLALGLTESLPVQQQLSVLRDLTAAMHDAIIACWAIKLRDWRERPITAIRRDLDPTFLPAVVTPGHPSYVSGHAVLSAAASTVLGQHLPLQKDDLWRKAEEAAMSRLWGGIHFRSDNEQGLKLGHSVGADVWAQRGALGGEHRL